MNFSLGELAERVGGEVQGSPARRLDGVRTLSEAGPTHLSFLTSPSYLEQASASAAGALLVGRDAQLPGRDLLRCAQPQLALAAICLLLWSFLLDGVVRSAAFMTATTSLFIGLLIIGLVMMFRKK